MIQKIKEIIDFYRLSGPKFAVKIGISPNTLNNYLQGKNKISLALIEAILTAFPEVSAEWLMRGKGQMIQGDQPTIMGDNSGVVAGHIEGKAITQGGELHKAISAIVEAHAEQYKQMQAEIASLHQIINNLIGNMQK